jgi:hypothetical protein
MTYRQTQEAAKELRKLGWKAVDIAIDYSTRPEGYGIVVIADPITGATTTFWNRGDYLK